jgi:hypothetical protein
MNEDSDKEIGGMTPMPSSDSNGVSLSSQSIPDHSKEPMASSPSQVSPTTNQPGVARPPSVVSDHVAVVDAVPNSAITPVIPSSEPMTSPAAPLAGRPIQSFRSKYKLLLLGSFVVIALAVLIALVYAVYRFGNNRGYASGKSAQAMASMAGGLKVPSDATMIAQCATGEGTQYVLPKNIPQGPIYNVWNNKVTGVEYMLGESEIANLRTQDLTMMGQKYDHIDVMYEPVGHAGFTEPHYHVILSFIPYSEEQKITCGSSSSSSMSM